MDNISERGAKRIQGYDLARGVAIVAMVIIDFKTFFCGDETFPEWLYALIDYMDRRAAVILVMIAGAGMTLLSRRAGMAKSRHTLSKRAVFLMLCGILLSRIWPADILHFYGFFILTGLAMDQLSSPGLLAGAAVFWLVSFLGFSDSVCGYLETLTSGSLPGLLADLFYRVLPGFSMGRALSSGHVAGTAGFKKSPDRHGAFGFRAFSGNGISVCRIFGSRYGGQNNAGPWRFR